eukprot:529301_1
MNVDSSNDTVKSRGRPSRRARNQNGQFSSSSTSTTSTAPPSISASVTPPPNPINLDEIIFPTRNPHLLNDIQSERNTRTNKFPYELVDDCDAKAVKDHIIASRKNHTVGLTCGDSADLRCQLSYEAAQCLECLGYIQYFGERIELPLFCNVMIEELSAGSRTPCEVFHEKISREARVRKTSVSKMYKSLEYSCGTRNIRNK